MKRLEVDPFGIVRERPKCPYCGLALGWWYATNRRHREACPKNPAFLASLETTKELAAHTKEAEGPKE